MNEGRAATEPCATSGPACEIAWARWVRKNESRPETTIDPVLKRRTRSREEGKLRGGGGERGKGLE